MPAIRARIQNIDRIQAIYDVYPLDQRIADSPSGNRTLAWLLGMLAGPASLLAAIGINSVISPSVRARELGIRIALGVEPGDVRALVLRTGMLPVLAGVALGVVGASAATRVLKSLLFGVNPGDPLNIHRGGGPSDYYRAGGVLCAGPSGHKDCANGGATSGIDQYQYRHRCVGTSGGSLQDCLGLTAKWRRRKSRRIYRSVLAGLWAGW